MEAFAGQGNYITGVSISMTALATSLVCWRMFVIYKRRGWLGVEEAMVFCSNIFLIIITVIACRAVSNGFGLHAKEIPAHGGDVHRALKFFFLFQIFYKCVICFNKLAFLFLYYRVFQFRAFAIICVASMVIIITGSFAFIMATILECLPIAYNWNKTIPNGHCINNSAFRWSWAGFNTVTDIWVSFLPIPFIQRLQMNKTKKTGLAFLFALGLFVCVASALRMKAMVQSTQAKDTPWDSAPAFLWSYVEASVGLICTCLPALRWLVASIFPKFGSTQSKTREKAYRLNRLSSSVPSGRTGANRPFSPRYGPGGTKFEGTVVGGNCFGESPSEERIIERSNGIQVKTSVSVRSTASSEETDTIKTGTHGNAGVTGV